jgi:hypothetical protein
MLKPRKAPNTAALNFSRPVPQRSADSVERSAAWRSAAEFSSEPSATAPASEESALFPFSDPKGVKQEPDAMKLTAVSRQLAASAAGKSSWTKCPQRESLCRTRTTMESARYRSPERATEFARSRVSHLPPVVWVRAEPGVRYERSLFLVGLVRPLVQEKLIRNRRACH